MMRLVVARDFPWKKFVYDLPLTNFWLSRHAKRQSLSPPCDSNLTNFYAASFDNHVLALCRPYRRVGEGGLDGL